MYKLRAELRVHSSDVRSVAVSSEGLIATTSRDNTIALWPAHSVEPLHVLRGHTHFVNAAAFCGVGKLVTASSDKTLRVWDVKSGECLKTLLGHTLTVCAVAWLPSVDAERIVSASWDQTARVWDLRSGQCVHELKGHEGAVWGVTSLQDGRIVTAGADKTVRVWDENGARSTTLDALHTDVVRDVIAGPKGGLITVANDSQMVQWKDNGISFEEARRYRDLHDGSYIYSVDGREVEAGKWTTVTAGEDNAVRVTQADLTFTTAIECTQTVVHPGTVWGAALCPDGDFVSACSDGVARVFTRDPSCVADADVLSSFEKLIAEQQINTKVIGGVDVNKLPEAKAGLAEPGKKDGEKKIVKTPSGTAEVYLWSAGEERWTKIGEVVDNPSDASGGGSVNGKTYDFVFEVELGEGGRKEKLGFNRGENPYLAAQRFVDDNELNQEFLDQIAQFIEQQVPKDALGSGSSSRSDPLTGGARYVPGGASNAIMGNRGDPLTGGSRYVPGGSSQSGSTGGADPLTGGSRYVPSGAGDSRGQLPPPRKMIPHRNGTILYKSTDQLDKIQTKLIEFNTEFAESESQCALDGEEAKVFGMSLMPKLKARGGTIAILDDADCAVVEKMLKWPTTHAFPVLDIARLVISIPSGCAYFFGSRNGEVLASVLAHLESSEAKAPVYIMGCRFLCNMFGNRVAGEKVRSESDKVLTSASGALRCDNRRARETFASLLINFALMLHDSKASVAEKLPVIERCVNVVSGGEGDEEVLYRVMIAIGTLMCDDLNASKAGVEVGVATAAADVAPKSARLQQIALELATIIAV